MKKINDPVIWEFAKLALQRNDEAIRYSETKAALLLTINGLILSFVSDYKGIIKEMLQNQATLIRFFAFFSVIIFFLGFFLVVIASLTVIFPRLKVSKRYSHLFFGQLAGICEKDAIIQIKAFNNKICETQIISQAHVTALIANKKFGLIRLAIIGTALVFFGLLTAVLLQFFI